MRGDRSAICDVNLDSSVNVVDLQLITNMEVGTATCADNVVAPECVQLMLSGSSWWLLSRIGSVWTRAGRRFESGFSRNPYAS